MFTNYKGKINRALKRKGIICNLMGLSIINLLYIKSMQLIENLAIV